MATARIRLPLKYREHIVAEPIPCLRRGWCPRLRDTCLKSVIPSLVRLHGLYEAAVWAPDGLMRNGRHDLLLHWRRSLWFSRARLSTGGARPPSNLCFHVAVPALPQNESASCPETRAECARKLAGCKMSQTALAGDAANRDGGGLTSRSMRN